jgi:hypothetical protein
MPSLRWPKNGATAVGWDVRFSYLPGFAVAAATLVSALQARGSSAA